MRKTVRQVICVRSARFVLGVLLAAVSSAISILVYANLKAGVLFAALFIAAGAVRIPDDMIPERYLPALYTAWLVITAFVTLVLSQFCLNEVLPERGLYVTILGLLLILSLFLVLSAFTLRIRITAVAVSMALIIFTCLNYFVFLFRGSEIAPADILSITTAGNVAAEYSFRVPAAMFYALTLSVTYVFVSYALPTDKINRRMRTRIICFITALLCMSLAWIGGLTIKPLHWLQTGSVINGYLYNFTIQLRDSFPQRPQDYSNGQVDAIAEQIMKCEQTDINRPDIVVVMDESFAELCILGTELNTDVEVTPFIDGIQENTWRGYVLASVFGGGTPNSEYEFLTGNSFLFLPTGSIAYQQFINEPSYSLASDLKSRGYSTIAMHQYLSSSWMREKIWPLLGFDECIFMDDFPQREMLRGWGTDQEMFEKIATVYEERKTISASPLFFFAVTIQNHGGYEYTENDFLSTVHLQRYSQNYPDAEQYLTCIHETDKAVEWLIRYFEQVDRDVVVLFYGDHFPRLSEGFFEEIHGGQFETLDEQMLQYEVPFFIWTNYPSESEEIELISMNYLAGLLYQRAGLELPPYNRYLEQLRQTIPACNAYGYYSKSADRFLPLEDAEGEEKQALLEYNYLEWNSMFDKEGRNETFFPFS